MDPARAPGQSSGRGHRLVHFHEFESCLGSLRNGVDRSSFRALATFKIQVLACFTVASPFHYKNAIVQALNDVSVSMLPFPQESDAIAV